MSRHLDREYDELHEQIAYLQRRVKGLESDLNRLWHFAGCPFDHCQTCIDDAEWIKGLGDRLGPPSAASVQLQHDNR